MSENNPIAVIAKFTFKKESIDEALKILHQLVKDTHKEQGCISYELGQDGENSTKYIMIERWASKQAWDVHMIEPHLIKAASCLESCLAEPVDVAWYNL